MVLEFLNRAMLRGIVVTVKTESYGDIKATNFSLCTNYAYTNKDGYPVLETTWFNINALQNDNIDGETIDKIQKGAWVEVMGRYRARRFVRSDGSKGNTFDIVANQLNILEPDCSNTIFPETISQ